MTVNTDSLNYIPINHGIVLGGANSTLGNLGPNAATGKVVMSNGAAADPIFSTATYPATSGTSGNVLTSDGTNFVSQAFFVGRDWTLELQTATGNPADSTSYFLATGSAVTAFTANGAATTRLYISNPGMTITAVAGVATVQGTLGSASNSSIVIRLNNTTDTTVTSTLAMTAAANTFSNNALSIVVTSGDYIEVKLVTPAWATNPTTVSISLAIYATN